MTATSPLIALFRTSILDVYCRLARHPRSFILNCVKWRSQHEQ